MKKQLKKIMTIVLTAGMVISLLGTPSFAVEHVGTSDAAKEMYKNTYANLTNRITNRGYAPTSLTGAYEGMFIRDSSIQVMAQKLMVIIKIKASIKFFVELSTRTRGRLCSAYRS